MNKILNVSNFDEIFYLMDIDGDGKMTQNEFILQILINEYNVSTEKIDAMKYFFFAWTSNQIVRRGVIKIGHAIQSKLSMSYDQNWSGNMIKIAHAI